MKINRSKFDAGLTNWVSGEGPDYTFEAKVFTEPSIYGIPTPRFEDGGNVSKLCIRDANGREVFSYDRGFEHSDDYADEIARDIVAALEAEFCEA